MRLYTLIVQWTFHFQNFSIAINQFKVHDCRTKPSFTSSVEIKSLPFCFMIQYCTFAVIGFPFQSKFRSIFWSILLDPYSFFLLKRIGKISSFHPPPLPHKKEKIIYYPLLYEGPNQDLSNNSFSRRLSFVRFCVIFPSRTFQNRVRLPRFGYVYIP